MSRWFTSIQGFYLRLLCDVRVDRIPSFILSDSTILSTLDMIPIQNTREHRINFGWIMYKLENKLNIFTA